VYPNLLQLVTPLYEGCIWAADFTHLDHRGTDVSVATVIDLFTRKIVGVAVSTKHDARFIIEAFGNALLSHGRPAILHSDNGSEYHAKSFRQMLANLGVSISRSQKGCPWENGYQESFYGKSRWTSETRIASLRVARRTDRRSLRNDPLLQHGAHPFRASHAARALCARARGC
jgi:transposase InsO family protein